MTRYRDSSPSNGCQLTWCIEIQWKIYSTIPGCQIASNFSTWYNSIAVMMLKFCSDYLIRNLMRTNYNWYNIWITTEKLLVRQAHDPCRLTLVMLSLWADVTGLEPMATQLSNQMKAVLQLAESLAKVFEIFITNLHSMFPTELILLLNEMEKIHTDINSAWKGLNFLLCKLDWLTHWGRVTDMHQ